MIIESAEQITKFIEQNHQFAECVLNEVRWQHYGTVIDLVIDYVWADGLTVRPDYLPPVLKTLRFHVVQEFHLANGLTVHTSLRPDALNWGISEMAAIRLLDDKMYLAPYSHLPVSLHHVRCVWEGERKIDIVFSSLEVL